MDINYVKELQDSINNSNNEFIQEQYDLDHAKSGAKRSLYFAHGNTEKNEINNRTAVIENTKAQSLNSKSVDAVNLATNAVTASKQSLVDAGKATSNISTAAANMQIAANAITKLSSDVAGVLAVATAADHGSQIQEAVERAHAKIKLAAKKAENVSMISLQATIDAAQSTASTVVTDAELAQASVNSLQQAAASDYSNTSAKVVSTDAALTEALKEEKAASGNFDIVVQQDDAIDTSRQLINEVSNHNLVLFDPAYEYGLSKNQQNKDFKLSKTKPLAAVGNSYTVEFEQFEHEKTRIANYNIVMVKYTEAQSFDINVAKDLNPGTYHQITPTGKDVYSYTFFLLGTKQALFPPLALNTKDSTDTGSGTGTDTDTDAGPVPVLEPETGSDKVTNVNVPGIAVDYKGKPIEQGVYYVTFIYAEYSTDYERILGTTDGYLTTMSEKIMLQSPLEAVPSTIDNGIGGTDQNIDPRYPSNIVMYEPFYGSKNIGIQFEVYKSDYNPDIMQYRIIMVEQANVTANKINQSIALAVAALDTAEFNYNVAQKDLEDLIDRQNEADIQFATLQTKAAILIQTVAETEDDIAKAELLLVQKQINENNELRGYLSDKIKKQVLTVEKKKVKYEKALKLESTLAAQKTSDFIFDVDLMQDVQPANFYVAQPFPWTKTSAKLQLNEAKEKLKLSRTTLIDAIELRILNQVNLAIAKVELAAKKAAEAKAKNELMQAEADMDQAQMDALVPPKSGQDTDTGAGSQNVDVQAAASVVQTKLNDHQSSQDDLTQAELELERAQNAVDADKDNVQDLFMQFIQTVYGMDRAETISSLVKKYDPNNAKNDKLLFFTEVGEDVTDNYGEPLQFNDDTFKEYFMTNLDEYLELVAQEDNDNTDDSDGDTDSDASSGNSSKTKISDDTKARIGVYLDTITVQSLKDLLPDDGIAYQAVILSALADTTDAVESGDQYMHEASDYSRPVVLFGPVV